MLDDIVAFIVVAASGGVVGFAASSSYVDPLTRVLGATGVAVMISRVFWRVMMP